MFPPSPTLFGHRYDPKLLYNILGWALVFAAAGFVMSFADVITPYISGLDINSEIPQAWEHAYSSLPHIFRTPLGVLGVIAFIAFVHIVSTSRR
jgi:hypothetical protein